MVNINQVTLSPFKRLELWIRKKTNFFIQVYGLLPVFLVLLLRISEETFFLFYLILLVSPSLVCCAFENQYHSFYACLNYYTVIPTKIFWKCKNAVSERVIFAFPLFKIEPVYALPRNYKNIHAQLG